MVLCNMMIHKYPQNCRTKRHFKWPDTHTVDTSILQAFKLTTKAIHVCKCDNLQRESCGQICSRRLSWLSPCVPSSDRRPHIQQTAVSRDGGRPHDPCGSGSKHGEAPAHLVTHYYTLHFKSSFTLTIASTFFNLVPVISWQKYH